MKIVKLFVIDLKSYTSGNSEKVQFYVLGAKIHINIVYDKLECHNNV